MALPGMSGVVGRRAKRLTYKGQYVRSTKVSSHTFTGVDIGEASADRLVVIVATGNTSTSSNWSIFGVTIDGVAGTIVANAHSPASYSTNTAIASRLVTAGTTISVTVQFAGAHDTCSIDVYVLTGLSSITAHHANTASAASFVPSLSTTINVPSGGIVIAGAGTSEAASLSWVGLNRNSDWGLSFNRNSAASDEDMAPATGKTITSNSAANDDRYTLAVASWN